MKEPKFREVEWFTKVRLFIFDQVKIKIKQSHELSSFIGDIQTSWDAFIKVRAKLYFKKSIDQCSTDDITKDVVFISLPILSTDSQQKKKIRF